MTHQKRRLSMRYLLFWIPTLATSSLLCWLRVFWQVSNDYWYENRKTRVPNEILPRNTSKRHTSYRGLTLLRKRLMTSSRPTTQTEKWQRRMIASPMDRHSRTIPIGERQRARNSTYRKMGENITYYIPWLVIIGVTAQWEKKRFF